MDADATERERALEARLAGLEARIQQLEGNFVPQGPESAVPNTLPAQAQPQLPGPTAPQPSYWMTKGGATAPVTAAVPAAGPANWNPAAPATARPAISLSASLSDLEARLTGRALAWVGGSALVLGAIFFLSLAFSRGWIGPELRVVIGLVAGAVCLIAGAVWMERANRLLGHVMTPVGLAVISISLVGATRLYHLIPVEVGLGLALVSAIAAAAIAIRANAPIVAAFGLVSVLAAPPLMDARPDLVTLAFVGAVLIGTTAIALWRTWKWLPPVAFVVSAPQVAAWIIGGPDAAFGMAGLGFFWLLNVLSAGGEAFRRRRDDLTASSASLLVANAAFVVWAGLELLSGDLAVYRGAFLLVIAVAHFAVGACFVVRDGERNQFGLLVLGTGVAVLTMAAPAQLGAPAVPIAWTAEAVALVWLAVRRSHPYSALASAVLFALAAGDLVWVYSSVGSADEIGIAAALAFFLAGIAAGAWLIRDTSARSVLIALGIVTASWCIAILLEGAAALTAVTSVAVAGVVARRIIPLLPSAPVRWQLNGLIPDRMRNLDDARNLAQHTISGSIGLVAAIALNELALDGAFAWTFAGLWAGLAIAALLLGQRDLIGRRNYLLTALTAIVAAGIAAVTLVAPPSRLFVTIDGLGPWVAIQTIGSIGLLVGALAVLGRVDGSSRVRRWAPIAAGISLLYLLSVAAVDLVASQVGRGLALEELRTQGQVALSVTWAASGVLGFVGGLRRRSPELRQGGLALLALATAKVFLFDLASLEVAYRVISLMALGLLLLASAWLWQRLQPSRSIEPADPLP